MFFCPCASPFLYTTNCPWLLRGSRRLPGLWLPAVLLVDLVVDPATTKKSRQEEPNQPHSNSSYFIEKTPPAKTHRK